MISPYSRETRVKTGVCINKMNFFKQLAAVVLAAFMILPPAPLMAGTRKGDKLRNEAREEETKGNMEKALELTSQALETDPGDPAYILQLHRIKFELGLQRLTAGRKLRAAGKLDDALAAFRGAYDADPSSDIAAQEIRRTQEMIDRARNGGKASADEDKGLTPAELARKEQQARTNALKPVPFLKPMNPEPIDLKMTNRPRTLFETLGKLAGINVLFDPDYNTQQTINTPVQIDLVHTTVESALDQLCLITKSFWQPRDENTIFVSIDNQNNRRAFTEQVVKVFYLTNPTTPQEIQEMMTTLRTVFDIQKVFNYTSQNALVVRCDADTMALVEKEIADLDKPRSEVVVDVWVMQVSSTYSRQLGMGLTGINTSAYFAPRASITTPPSGTSEATTSNTTTPITGNGGDTNAGAPIPLSQLGHISTSDYSIINLPGATFQAMLSDSSTRVLQSPQIRATHNSKSSIKIGTKIPIATGSFQSAVGAVGSLPAANTQFSFQDVGVTLEIQPQVHDNNEVSMTVDLDVSQVLDRIDVGGVSQPEIADNKVTAQIRLREGEVNLIGGIIQDTNHKTISGLPGLAKIPVLGRLFGGEDTEKNKTELVIALIPHIVRGPEITASNLKGVAAGTSTQIRVSYDSEKLNAAAETGEPAVPAAVPGAVVVPGAPPATAPPPTAPRVIAPPVTAPPVTVPPVTAPPVTAPPAPAQPASAPPATAPPPTAPFVTAPPATAAPVTAPPATAPPATAPPATAPPFGRAGGGR
jgi:general secretion pathway protein D